MMWLLLGWDEREQSAKGTKLVYVFLLSNGLRRARHIDLPRNTLHQAGAGARAAALDISSRILVSRAFV
jgi:hypothetical protein